MFSERYLWKKLIFFLSACLTVFTMVISMFTQFWAVVITEIFSIFIAVQVIDRKRLRNFSAGILVIFMFFSIFIFALVKFSPDSKSSFTCEIHQIMSFDKGIEEFTNKRYHIWVEAINHIKKKPVLGYGWEDLAKYSVEKREHTHSAWTQVAWTAGVPAAIMFISLLFINALNSFVFMFKRKKLIILPFVLFIAIIGLSTIGCLDDVFRASRRVTFPYWILLTLPLTPVFYMDIENKQVNKDV